MVHDSRFAPKAANDGVGSRVPRRIKLTLGVMSRLLVVMGLLGAMAVAAPAVALEPICSSPAVIFCEDFETTTLPGRWADGYNSALHQIATTQAHQGTHALQVTWPQGSDGGWLTTWLTATGAVPTVATAGYEHLFVRAFWKRDATWRCWPASLACGKMIAQYGLQTGTNGPFNSWSGFGQAGTTPSGSDWYYSSLVTLTTPANETFSLYTYYPEMTSQYGEFAQAAVQMPLDQWVCVEHELQTNTPGQHDGFERIYINGALVKEVMGRRFRDTTNLQTGAVQLTFSGSGANVPTQHEYVDDIVVSRQRVGCDPSVSTRPSNPTNVQVK